MKVLILDEQTGLYLAHQDRWVSEPSAARDMAFSVHAAAVARNLGLTKFQVFFFFEEINYKISVFASQQSVAA